MPPNRERAGEYFSLPILADLGRCRGGAASSRAASWSHRVSTLISIRQFQDWPGASRIMPFSRLNEFCSPTHGYGLK